MGLLGRQPAGRVGVDDVGLQGEAAQVVLEFLQALGRPVDGGDPGAGRRQLRRLAPWRRAQVDDA